MHVQGNALTVDNQAQDQVPRIGRAVRARRLDRGWNQSDLARRSGTQPSYIFRLESGIIRRPSVERLAPIASALGCRLADLTDPPADPLDVDILEHVRTLCGADEAKFRQVLDLLAKRPPEQRASALAFIALSLETLDQHADHARPSSH
jgi:transcriptional regulator with XRE-family HTH domain